MILRLSQKLNTKIKAGKLSEMPLDENPYADWSCHLFTADHTQYIILSNTASLYSCVMYGRQHRTAHQRQSLRSANSSSGKRHPYFQRKVLSFFDRYMTMYRRKTRRLSNSV
jgi:hypothetical protein